jgi:hypothetical protein
MSIMSPGYDANDSQCRERSGIKSRDADEYLARARTLSEQAEADAAEANEGAGAFSPKTSQSGPYLGVYISK